MSTFMLVFCGLCGWAAAQDPVSGQGVMPARAGESEESSSRESDAADDPDNQSSEEAVDEPDDQTSMTIDDARLNFATVVESFIAAHSSKGYWPLKQKTTGKVLQLKFENALEKTVRRVSRGLFAGRVVLRDISQNRLIKAEFFVDLSGRQWSVTRLRLLPTGPKAGVPPKKAADSGPLPVGDAQPAQPSEATATTPPADAKPAARP